MKSKKPEDIGEMAVIGVDIGKDTFHLATAHPIENPSVDWEKNGAKFMRLAELTLSVQENSAEKDAYAAQLMFNPWMGLPAHQPIGAINRARRLVYDAMSRLRKKGFG